MFILQTELPHYFHFKTNINKNGELEFYLEDEKIEYIDIAEWISNQYHLGEEKQKVAEDLIEENKLKLEKLKVEIAAQEIEYLAKEKQISTFLECKKSFFGKFKYYFKYSKKNIAFLRWYVNIIIRIIRRCTIKSILYCNSNL